MVHNIIRFHHIHHILQVIISDTSSHYHSRAQSLTTLTLSEAGRVQGEEGGVSVRSQHGQTRHPPSVRQCQAGRLRAATTQRGWGQGTVSVIYAGGGGASGPGRAAPSGDDAERLRDRDAVGHIRGGYSNSPTPSVRQTVPGRAAPSDDDAVRLGTGRVYAGNYNSSAGYSEQRGLFIASDCNAKDIHKRVQQLAWCFIYNITFNDNELIITFRNTSSCSMQR